MTKSASRRLQAGVAFIPGTAPLSATLVLWYARTVGYDGAIRGPGLFRQVGGGPFMLLATGTTLLWAAIWWVVALRAVGPG